MNPFVSVLTSAINRRIEQTIGTNNGSRLMFHGPNTEILELVFNELLCSESLRKVSEEQNCSVPILLLTDRQKIEKNPDMGASGRCDETHLLHLRNDPTYFRFVALVPPGLHSTRSIESTADEFGISAKNNASHSSFDNWWNDEFVQHLITEAIIQAGLAEQEVEARNIVEYAARAIDDISKNTETKDALWRLISRIFSVSEHNLSLSSEEAWCLACGMPKPNGVLSYKKLVSILQQLSELFCDGFTTGRDRIFQQLNEEPTATIHLDNFVIHLKNRRASYTEIERAISAFYLPKDELTLFTPPTWWNELSEDDWLELLTEEPEALGALRLECTNGLFVPTTGCPVVVNDEAALTIFAGDTEQNVGVKVSLAGMAGKEVQEFFVVGSTSTIINRPSPRKTPITYKISAQGFVGASVKVLSLSSWLPGLFATCRIAKKVSIPKSLRKGKGNASWESELRVPGSGRYEIEVYLSPDSKISGPAISIHDDTSEREESSREIIAKQLSAGKFLFEIEVEGKFQLDIPVIRTPINGPDVNETFRVYIISEDVKEEGCRSEFERLINENRAHIEKIDIKQVVQLNRNARSSSLQTWILDKDNIEKSFLPLVIADDYAKVWSPPRWGELKGSVLSEGSFLHDPRPTPELFSPPNEFIKARCSIAAKIRSATDEQSGLVESAPLGKWLNSDPIYAELIEQYLDSYQKWFKANPEIACWTDVIAAVPLGSDGRTLQRTPDAILLSPLHPLRLAWHSVAQGLLVAALEKGQPCPAASVLAPGQIPDIFTMPIQAPEKTVNTTFIAIESSSDYWSILWNGQRLNQISSKAGKPPFDDLFGLTIGSVSGGFSATQVQRSLDDVSGILSAKPILNLTLSSAGGVTDSCNEGLVSWCTKRLGSKESERTPKSMGSRVIQLFDTRSIDAHLDDAIIANLSEDTNNRVRWFKRQPKGITSDLGIIAQLDSSEPEIQGTLLTSPISVGGLLRHRIRTQFSNAFLLESRQAAPVGSSGFVLEDKLTECLITIENMTSEKFGYQYAPNVNAVKDMFEQNLANFVAISSASFDPACFSGGWLKNSYLWDYELPSYSPRAGDTNGYYLLSKINDVDKDGLAKVLKKFPECSHLEEGILEEILFEVSRRGIPTVKGLSGAHTTATGDLGLFIASRLLQDQFRMTTAKDSLLPLIKRSEDGINIALIVPVDPFKGYLADLAKSLGKNFKDITLLRPDLIVVGITIRDSSVFLKLTPIEVKFRQNTGFSRAEAKEALGQAHAFSNLLKEVKNRDESPLSIWKIAFQHLLLSMVGFGFRIYGNHQISQTKSNFWSDYYKRVFEMILTSEQNVSIDEVGRLIIIDDSRESIPGDNDSDGFNESVTLSKEHAGKIIAGDPELFYDRVRKMIGDWNIYPRSKISESGIASPAQSPWVAEQTDEFHEENADSLQLALGMLKDDKDTSPKTDSCGVILKVGHIANAFEPRQITLNVSNTQLNQLNIGVVGDLGTGKTQLLKSLIYQVAASEKANRGIKPKFLIFDYKRDYSSKDFVDATKAKVVKPFQLPLNLFDTSDIGETNIPWLDRFRFFADVLDKIYAGIGPVQRDKLKNATRTAYELATGQEKSPTIYDIHSCYRNILNGKSDSPMAIIDDLVDMEVFTRDDSKIIPFSEFLDGVVVISLDSMGQDDRSKNIVVAIMLNMFYENMLKTPKRGFIGTEPQLRAIDSYLLVDEADNIMRYEFDVLRKLLLQGREFGTGVILASQYLRHFKGNATDYKEPLLTWFIHKVPNITAQELATLGLAARLDEVVQSVKELPNHHCLYKTHDTGGEFIAGLPFYKLLNFE